MSDMYFSAMGRTAAVRGSERAWLNTLVTNVARPWWGLDSARSSATGVERAMDIAGMIPETPSTRHVNACVSRVMDQIRVDGLSAPPFANDLVRSYADQVVTDILRYREECERATLLGRIMPRCDQNASDELIPMLRASLAVDDIPLVVGSHTLWSKSLEFNTALAVGATYVCLAAKIHGWCETNAWIPEGDREWVAMVIDDALTAGVFRRGRVHRFGAGESLWREQGWADVTALLRDTASAPGAVVLSYSGACPFPSAEVSTLMPAWLGEFSGCVASLPEERREELTAAMTAWNDLPEEQRWETSLDGLMASQPWASISESNIRTTTFGPSLTLLDLFGDSRDSKIDEAVSAYQFG